jgi:hypothetical protein
MHTLNGVLKMLNRGKVYGASTTKLQARMDEIDNGAPEDFDGEARAITSEIDNRGYFDSSDERVREGTGNA